MPLTYLEAFLIGAAVLLLGALFILLHYARGILGEARRLRDHTQAAEVSANLQTRLLDVTPTLIAALDGMHRYLAVNQAFEETVGMDRSRLIGAKAGSMEGVAGSLGAQLEAFAAQCAATDQAITEIVKVSAANGRAIDGLLIVQPFYVGKDSPGGALVALVDITDRVSAQREARDIKDTIEDLIGTLPMAFFRIREEVGGHRWFPYFVGHTERFLRLPASDIRKRSGTGELPNVLETNWPTARAAMDESRAKGTSIQIDLEVHRLNDDGWIRIGTAVPRPFGDGTTEWNGYLIDVTQEHRDGLALGRAKAAAEANADAKARFLAAMSHEIRTPLATTVGALELLRGSPLNAAQRQHVELADNASHLLMEIIGDILDFSRLDAGELGLEAIPFSMRELLDQVLHIFSTGARDKGLTLDLRVARGVAEEFMGDPVRIKQIVLNLVGNAIKFTAAGGIAVAVDIDPDGSNENPALQSLSITVADTGIGISSDTQRRLFQPFVQADASTARQYGGSGLGLAICLRLARLLGGDIRLESREGQGSVFQVRLPLHVSRPSEPNPSLLGRSLFLSVRRAQDQACLQEYARTLGLSLVPAADDADLRITDEPVVDAVPARPGTVIALVGQSLADSQALPVPASLCSGPIRWTDFKRVCLTALQPPQLVASAAAVLPENLPTPPLRRILVVEDHLPYQIVIRNLLERLGAVPDVVADGPKALQMLEQARYDLIITDCHLPGMDGFELTRRIRALADAGIRDLPIVALSADVSPDHLQRSSNAGMNDFLVKPVNLSTLRECIEKWTDEGL
ncbi:hybrid sensor histidine kinase/response regulator [Achromobacter deleyi]|uniref:hybrid sensor histidine kinase/response regulator n=1 Tax=Achromobacter deleyi TaxID=1353891 RepID=UPI001490F2C8|nr:ATP-binding protein [Achromobacter deleyi]QVQ26829.1 response regulator [Achromobacter deleyi]UIP22405.1 ATP-binding protein [Achromobacter deleyi]